MRWHTRISNNNNLNLVKSSHITALAVTGKGGQWIKVMLLGRVIPAAGVMLTSDRRAGCLGPLAPI